MSIRSLMVYVVIVTLTGSPINATSQQEGSIGGTVRDPQGAVLPGASVTVSESGRGTVRTVFTDAEGTYRVTGLSQGTYTIRVELSGFREVVHDGVRVDRTAVTADIALTLTGLLETVVVTGTRADQELGKIPAAMSVVDTREALRGQQMTNVNEVLKRVPGVAMRVHLDGSTRAVPSCLC